MAAISGPAVPAPARRWRRPLEPGVLGPLATATAAVALAGAAFVPVFPGTSAVAPMVIAAVGPALVVLAAAIGRGHRWPAWVPAGLSLVALWVIAAAFGSRSWPTPAALARVVTGLRDGWAQLLSASIPVAARGGPLVTAMALTGLASTVTALLVVRTPSPLGPVVPALVLETAALGFGAAGHTVPLILSALMIVALGMCVLLRARAASARLTAAVHDAATAADVLSVDPALAGTPGLVGATPARPRPPLGRLAVGLGLVAVVAVTAPVVGPRLPGVGARDRYDPRVLRSPPVAPRTSLSPLSDVAALRAGGATVAFRVRTAARPDDARWRTAVLDDFDGQVWSTAARFRRASTALPLDPTSTVARQRVAADVSLEGLATTAFLPALDRPTEISVDGLGVDPETGVLVVPTDRAVPTRYHVVSAVAQVSTQQYRLAGNPYGISPVPIPPDIATPAQQATAKNPSAFGKMADLVGLFRDGGFTLDTRPDAPAGHGLFQIRRTLTTKAGTAEQYASAFAVMAMSLGYRARVGVGFRAGSLDPATSTYTVTDADVDAWPEVLFDGLGWVRFDPSPRTQGAGGSAGQAPSTPAPSPREEAVDAARTDASAATTVPPVDLPSSSGSSSSVPLVLLAGAAGVALLAALGLALVVAAKRRRTTRRRRAPDAADRVLGAWEDAGDRLREHGVSVPAWMTASEVVAAARRDLGAERTGALAPLARLLNATRYDPTGPPADAAVQAWAQRDELVAGLRAGQSVAEQARATLSPAPLLPDRLRHRRPAPSASKVASAAQIPVDRPPEPVGAGTSSRL